MQTETKQDFREAWKQAVGDRSGEGAANFARETPEMPGEVLPIGLDLIQPSARNPRQDLGDLTALIASVRASGVLSPLLVRELEPFGAKSYEVVSGHRRLAAAKAVGLEAVPCIVIDADDVQALELNLAEQLQRAQLTPLEEGLACRSLQEISGYSVAQVASKLGQSPSWVQKRVALTGLAPELQTALSKGEMQLGVAAALASLPAHRAQVQAFADCTRAASTAEGQVDFLRTNVCRPLKGAPWKLTDELLVPEAGACAACPHNSANDKMPGLFDAGQKKSPSCANPSCYDDKARAVWAKKTEAAKENGAKVLSLAEGQKLFGAGGHLPYGSRYVEADVVVQEDRQKRTWAQLLADVPEDAQPRLHLAQDREGKARELYLHADALKAVAKHLKLKWATKAEASAAPAKKDNPKKADDEKAAREAREAVTDEALAYVAKKLLKDGLGLPEVRALADQFALDVTAFGQQVLGRKLPASWLLKEATMTELLVAIWWTDTRSCSSPYHELSDELIATAKRHGFDMKAAVKARLDAEKKAKTP